MNFGFWEIAILLLGAKIGGELFRRLRQPSLAGELLAGIAMGATFANLRGTLFFVDLAGSETVQLVAQLGIMFLILLAMISIDLSSIEREIERLVLAQAVSAVIIYALLVTILPALSLTVNQTLIIWAAIFGSSTAISAKTLLTINGISTKEGQAVIGLQIVNGIIELLLISSVTNVLQYSQFSVEPVLKLALMIIGTFAVMSRVGSRFINWLFNLFQVLRLDEVFIALTLVLAFSAAAVTEAVGMTPYIGYMLVGVLVSRTEQSKSILKRMGDLGEAFFIPVFFASLGLAVSVGALAGNVVLVLALLAVVTAIRFLAYTIPMVLLSFSLTDAVKVGSGLLPMSEYGLLMLSVGLAYGVLANPLYSVLVAVFLIVNVAAPLVTGRVFRLPSYSGGSMGRSEIKGW
ncbi:MAG TPA: cation:proton antiporter [Methanomicrobiales archaeon]|nr:cation:proton antiporter [Methanomicrobiales archaeon]